MVEVVHLRGEGRKAWTGVKCAVFRVVRTAGVSISQENRLEEMRVRVREVG